MNIDDVMKVSGNISLLSVVALLAITHFQTSRTNVVEHIKHIYEDKGFTLDDGCLKGNGGGNISYKIFP